MISHGSLYFCEYKYFFYCYLFNSCLSASDSSQLSTLQPYIIFTHYKDNVFLQHFNTMNTGKIQQNLNRDLFHWCCCSTLDIYHSILSVPRIFPPLNFCSRLSSFSRLREKDENVNRSMQLTRWNLKRKLFCSVEYFYVFMLFCHELFRVLNLRMQHTRIYFYV